jgi:segregation and condensation protein B
MSEQRSEDENFDSSTQQVKQIENESELAQILESIIFANPKPIGITDLINVLMNAESQLVVEEEEIYKAVDRLNKEYEENGRSFRIKETGGGFTFATRDIFHPWLQHIQHENLTRKITQSALETLSIIAYKQPITKPIIDSIRGVDSGYVVKQLLEKGLVRVAGRADSPGRPLLYKTTDVFLQHFGINEIDELPKPREIDEILQDDDMSEHRQIMMELKAELYNQEQENNDHHEEK